MIARKGPTGFPGERGIALIAALSVLVLCTLIAFGFMMASKSERALSSNVQLARATLYAADGGVRAARQTLGNMARAKLDSLIAVHGGGSSAVIPQPNNLFPAGDIALASTDPPFNVTMRVTFDDSTNAGPSQIYDYSYTITSSGRWGANGLRRVRSDGGIRLSAGRGSFADYLMFTDIHTPASGGDIWFTSDGYFDGRLHTNGEFKFAFSPTFMDLITSVDTRAWFRNLGSPIELNADTNPPNDVPTYNGGFQRGVPNIPLPANAFNQQNAALGLSPTSSTPPSNSTINTILATGAGAGAPPGGIYVPNDGASVVGGLYVQGNVDACALSIDVGGRQVYTMAQGGTTRTVTVDRATNQTIVFDGAITNTYAGVPRGVMYVNGRIASLAGPPRVAGTPQPALARGTELLIAATDDVVLQNDVICKDFNDATNVLGIFSSGGKVRVGTAAPNDMHLDAYVMATGGSGEFCVDNYNSGAPRGTFHLRGGSVAKYYGLFYKFDKDTGLLEHGYARDFKYDVRGMIPPYFPTTSVFTANVPALRTTVWKEL